MKNIFSLFKKREPISIDLLIKIFSQVNSEYYYLKHQIDEGLIIAIKKTDSPFKNYYKSRFNIKLLNKLEDKKGKNFTICGIFINDLNTKKSIEININVCYGIILGYYFDGNVEINPDLNSINLSNFKIKYHDDLSFIEISKILNSDELKLINSSDVYEVNLNGKTYYHIKDLEDGDFIGMDKQKNFYEISHDPVEVKLIKSTLKDILK